MSDKKDLLNNLKIDRTAPPSEEPMTPLVRYGILGAISVAIVIGWLFFTSEEPVEVTTFTVKEINQNDTSASSILDASGYVTARRQATVSSKITGKVLKVFIEEGDVVKEGQILAQLDDSTYVAEMNYAEAQFKEAKRVFDRTYELIEGQLASQASLDAARASMDSLEALYTVRKQFESLDEFIKHWNNSERKQVIIDELAAEGVIWKALEDDVSRELDPFDLI